MRNHLEDNDSSTIAAVLDQLHEALGDLLHGEDAVGLLQHGPVPLPPVLVVQDCSVGKRGTDALNLDKQAHKTRQMMRKLGYMKW